MADYKIKMAMSALCLLVVEKEEWHSKSFDICHFNCQRDLYVTLPDSTTIQYVEKELGW